jgi:aminoglycoside phosphotransferase (APT) family kinase protein
VTDVVTLTGGWTSTMLALTTTGGDRAVLRLMTNEPWRTHGAELATREHQTQQMLADTDVPAPRSIALDADGTHTGEAAHLMTLLPGVVEVDRVSAADLETLAGTLARIHDLRPTEEPRTYQSWAWPAKYIVPEWAREPAAWKQAFAVLGQDPPTYDGTFLHRDFQPRNVLWTATVVTGIVDWVETSWGPAWLDVAHFSTHLALRHGSDAADRFAEVYRALTGSVPAPYFDVMDVVGLLPAPGRRPFLNDPGELRRLEERLVAVLARL